MLSKEVSSTIFLGLWYDWNWDLTPVFCIIVEHSTHVWLNNKDTFCLYNFSRILPSFLKSVLVLGWSWWINLPKLSRALLQSYKKLKKLFKKAMFTLANNPWWWPVKGKNICFHSVQISNSFIWPIDRTLSGATTSGIVNPAAMAMMESSVFPKAPALEPHYLIV